MKGPKNKKTDMKQDVFNTVSCDIYFFISLLFNSLKFIETDVLPNRFLLQIIGLLNNTVRLHNCIFCLC